MNRDLEDAKYFEAVKWDGLVVDEAHRLKNAAGLLYRNLNSLRPKTRMLLTGTPIQNNLGELYSLLSFASPYCFPPGARDDFLARFEDVGSDGDDAGKQQQQHQLRRLIAPFMLRRTKADVADHINLPSRTQLTLYAGLSGVQRKLYKALLLKSDLAAITGASGNKRGALNLLMELRKCANHPYLFDGVEPEPFESGEHLVESAGKLKLLDRLLRHMQSTGHRVLVFSQMTRVLDVLQDFLELRKFDYKRLDGSIRGEDRFSAIDDFNSSDGAFVFLLSTRAGGLGITLSKDIGTCHTRVSRVSLGYFTG